jgi:hypothetical protein
MKIKNWENLKKPRIIYFIYGKADLYFWLIRANALKYANDVIIYGKALLNRRIWLRMYQFRISIVEIIDAILFPFKSKHDKRLGYLMYQLVRGKLKHKQFEEIVLNEHL